MKFQGIVCAAIEDLCWNAENFTLNFLQTIADESQACVTFNSSSFICSFKCHKILIKFYLFAFCSSTLLAEYWDHVAWQQSS